MPTIQDFEKMHITPDDLGTASKVLDILRAAIPVTDAAGNVVAVVRDDAIAKKVQWAIAAQAAAKEDC